MKSNILKIGPGKISEIESTLKELQIIDKILHVSDPYVHSLYGSTVRPQIEAVGRIKEQSVDYIRLHTLWRLLKG